KDSVSIGSQVALNLCSYLCSSTTGVRLSQRSLLSVTVSVLSVYQVALLLLAGFLPTVQKIRGAIDGEVILMLAGFGLTVDEDKKKSSGLHRVLYLGSGRPFRVAFVLSHFSSAPLYTFHFACKEVHGSPQTGEVSSYSHISSSRNYCNFLLLEVSECHPLVTAFCLLLKPPSWKKPDLEEGYCILCPQKKCHNIQFTYINKTQNLFLIYEKFM
ncbi:unnamed protein product, partial [Ranitomeya imitator]